MAKLNKKVAPVEEAVVGESIVEEKEPALTDLEIEAIQNAEEEVTFESADTGRLQLATNVVSKQFNLDPSYNVTKFDDKGKVVKVTLENKDFIVNVTIKDSERHGMCVD